MTKAIREMIQAGGIEAAILEEYNVSRLEDLDRVDTTSISDRTSCKPMVPVFYRV